MIFKINFRNNKQSGVTLLLSILILSAILAISFSLATILFIEVRTSGDLLRTEASYYGGQGVTEEALFKVKRQAPLNYTNTFGSVSLGNPVPVETQLTEPIFQDKVNPLTTVQNTSNRYPLFNPNDLTGGSGYSYITITKLPSGNSNPLVVYVCQFDPHDNADSYNPPGEPCTSYDSDSTGYWNLTNARNYSISDTEKSHSWFLNSSMQQQIIIVNPPSSGSVNFTIQAYAIDGTGIGIPYSGKTAVKIVGGIGGISRKITVVIPNIQGNSNSTYSASVSHVQSTVSSAYPSSNSSLSFSNNVIAGNTIIVGILWSYSGCPPSVTDTQGNSYTQGGQPTQTDSSYYMYWFSAPVSSSGSNTVFISAACGTSQIAFASEYSGLSSLPFDSSNTQSNTSSSCFAGNLTTSQNGELILGVFMDSASRSFTAGNGFVQRVVNNINGIMEDQVQTTAGSINPTTTCSANNTYPAYGFSAAFKPMSVSGTGPTGSITIVKNTNGGDGTFNFTTSGGASLPGSFSITSSGGSGNVSYSTVNIGTYSISETIPGSWSLTSASCDDGYSAYNYPAVTNIKVAAGSNITCTFNNIKTVNSGYAHYRKIDVDGSKVVGSNQSSFPVLVCFNGSAPCNQSVPELKNVGNGGVVTSNAGNDIIFTSDSGGQNILPFEKEKYVSSTGEAIYWVKLSLTQGSPTTFYMFYGNSGDSDHSNKTSVWDANYKAVYHLNQISSGNATDSTLNNNTLNYGPGSICCGLPFGPSPTADSSTEIGSGIRFNATNQYYGGSATTTSDLGLGTGSRTISAWVKPVTIFSTDGNQAGLLQTPGNGGIDSMSIYVTDSGGLKMATQNASWQAATIGNSNISTNNWYYITGVWDGSSIKLYLNGNLDSTASLAGSMTESKGKISNIFRHLVFSADEIRFSNTNRSPGWIATEYNNQNSPSTFYTVGAEQ